ncbi:MAG: glycosyltransferase family 4 protein [Candidatus Omnitrophica bacterium]|nr:glycosyltransferase family 4 protein [Candidatus Omnitrophota bacterium]
MKILLIGNYVNDGQVSMQRFSTIMESALRQRGHDVSVIRPEPFFGRLMPSYKGIGKWLGYIDKFILFPSRLRGALPRAEIAHICDHSNAFYAKYLKDIPYLITCHDLLAIRSALGEIRENPTKWTGRRLQKMILSGLKIARHIVCISGSTKDDILRLTKLDSENVSVISYGFNYSYSAMGLEEAKTNIAHIRIDTARPFFLHIGKDAWYKNRLGALHIFNNSIKFDETSEFNMVFVGDDLSKEMRSFIKRQHLEDRVFAIPFLESEGMRALYSTAKGLLYPSLSEGFGWPIIEAQACGCPVFTTDRPPMTEVGGDAAVYIDPAKPQEAARAIVESLRSKEKMATMRETGFVNVKRFSTENMVTQYINLYEKLIMHRKP